MGNEAGEIIAYPGSNIKSERTIAKLKSKHIKLSYSYVSYGVWI